METVQKQNEYKNSCSGPAYWVQTKFPISELDGAACLLRIADHGCAEENIFILETSAHPTRSEYHRIIARFLLDCPSSKIVTVVVFDQQRADQLRKSDAGDGSHAFIADLDLRIPLQPRPDI